MAKIDRSRIFDRGNQPDVLASEQGSGPWMSIPLTSTAGCMGMILVARDQQPFTSNDAKFLELLAGPSAAQAVEIHQEDQLRRAEALKREVQIAGKIQQRMLPQSSPDVPGYDVRGYLQTASTVGGDYYDHLFIDDTLLLIIADVSGHSIAAALAMSMVRTSLRTFARETHSPADLLERINKAVCEDLMSSGLFVSATIMTIDIPSGNARLSNAGHPPAYIRRANGVLEPLDSDGMVLGYLPTSTFENVDAILHPGDAVCMYTDGVTEAQHPTGKFFGDDLLRAAISRPSNSADEILHTVLNAVQEWAFSQRNDDTTMLICHRAIPVSHPSLLSSS